MVAQGRLAFVPGGPGASPAAAWAHKLLRGSDLCSMFALKALRRRVGLNGIAKLLNRDRCPWIAVMGMGSAGGGAAAAGEPLSNPFAWRSGHKDEDTQNGYIRACEAVRKCVVTGDESKVGPLLPVLGRPASAASRAGGGAKKDKEKKAAAAALPPSDPLAAGDCLLCSARFPSADEALRHAGEPGVRKVLIDCTETDLAQDGSKS